MIHPRTHLTRATALMAVAIIVLSLVLSGSAGVGAQAPDEKQYGPATADEIQALEAAAQNVGVPNTSVFDSGYPGSIMPEADAVAFADAIDAWSANWAVGRLCAGSEECLVGDFNGDKKDDVAVLYRETRGEPQAGDVMVATSKGLGLNAATKWSDSLCRAGQICRVGDPTTTAKTTSSSSIPTRPASAARETFRSHCLTGTSSRRRPSGMPTSASARRCARWATSTASTATISRCSAGALIRSPDWATSTWRSRTVRTASARSVNWQGFFCIADEECRVADMNGDRADDIVTFIKTGDGKGRVAVALSIRYRFADASDWAAGFCMNDEQCELGDFDANGMDDALKFVRAGTGGTTYGDVYVRLSNGSA